MKRDKEMIKKKKLGFFFLCLFLLVGIIFMLGLFAGCYVLPQQEPPDIAVTSERIKEEIGYELFVPEGASEFEYRMNVDSHIGYVGFLLDGVTYTAKVKKSDVYISIENPKVEENWIEIDNSFKNTKIGDVEGQTKCYRIEYDNLGDRYATHTQWFLEEEGYMVSLSSFSEELPEDLPTAEVFH